MTISAEITAYRAKVEAGILDPTERNKWYLWEQLALLSMAGFSSEPGDSGSGGAVVSSFDLAETITAATWTALAAGATRNITVRNRTGTNIDIRKTATTTFITLANNEDVTLPVLANSNEWEIKRTDNNATAVTVKFLRFA
jgi:hypothetical protein